MKIAASIEPLYGKPPTEMCCVMASKTVETGELDA